MLRFSDQHLVEGMTEAMRAEHEEKLRAARLEAARRNPHWQEVSEMQLVRRNRSWFVEADSDIVLQAVRGVVFDPAGTSVIATMTELSFTVSDEGDLTFYERVPGVPTWTWFLEQQQERERRRNAPKAKPAWM
jgi:hypothetical protein